MHLLYRLNGEQYKIVDRASSSQTIDRHLSSNVFVNDTEAVYIKDSIWFVNQTKVGYL